MLKYFTCLLLTVATTLSAQQYPDTLYTPFIVQAAYPAGEGPRVTFDKGHNNFGADIGGYAAYAPENAQMVRNLFHWLSEAKVPFNTPVEKPQVPEKTQLVKEIEAQLQAMEVAYESGDLLSCSYFYADDAVITGDGFQIKGREAIDKYWFSFEGLTESWQLDSDLVYGTGELAYQLGKSTISYRNPGSEKVVTDVTRFTLVWRKNFAGNWKIVSDQYAKE